MQSSTSSKKMKPYPAIFFLATILSLTTAVCHATSESDDTARNVVYETVTIGEQIYDVPSPWAGNKLQYPQLSYEDFGKIPARFTVNGSKLYIIKEAQSALVTMLDAALKDNVQLQVESGYRSRTYQKKIFLKMFQQGRSYQDIIRYVAPPGYSQHGLGTAVDFYPSNWRFAELPAYIWLRENGKKYGFVETYSEFNTLKYPWEAWHWNYHPPSQ